MDVPSTLPRHHGINIQTPLQRPPLPANALNTFEERCQTAKEQPFVDEQPLVGNPCCSWNNFRLY
jgi:hypothetical protein